MINDTGDLWAPTGAQECRPDYSDNDRKASAVPEWTKQSGVSEGCWWLERYVNDQATCDLLDILITSTQEHLNNI